jgi:hypothetical protein
MPSLAVDTSNRHLSRPYNASRHDGGFVALRRLLLFFPARLVSDEANRIAGPIRQVRHQPVEQRRQHAQRKRQHESQSAAGDQPPELSNLLTEIAAAEIDFLDRESARFAQFDEHGRRIAAADMPAVFEPIVKAPDPQPTSSSFSPFFVFGSHLLSHNHRSRTSVSPCIKVAGNPTLRTRIVLSIQHSPWSPPSESQFRSYVFR